MDILFAISFLSILAGLICFIFHAFGGEKKYFRSATIFTLIGFLNLTALIIMQGIHYGFQPVNYLAQPCNILAWLMLVAYFFAEYKVKARILGALFIPIVVVSMLIPTLSGEPAPVAEEALTSPFIVNLHVALLLASFTLFFLAFSEAIIYIIKTRALKSHKSRAIDGDLPSLGKLQKILIGTFNLGWITMTAGYVIAYLNVAVTEETLDVNGKIIFGTILWFCYTVLFVLYQSNKIGTRNLARAITFLFLLFMSFWVVYSGNLWNSSSPAPDKQVEEAGEQ